MIFPLDTNAFSDLMRKHAKVETPLTSLTAGDRVIIGPIVMKFVTALDPRHGSLVTETFNADLRLVLKPTLIALKENSVQSQS